MKSKRKNVGHFNGVTADIPNTCACDFSFALEADQQLKRLFDD